MSAGLNTPVLLLVYNRHDTAAQVFEAIRQARPAALYVAADGPKADRPDDRARCQAVRRLVEQVDWPCRVALLFRDENLGCRRAVSSAIDWFFQHEDAGIILEDDCLPSHSFFRFADEMLLRFRDEPRVMMVTGYNSAGHYPVGPCSYFFGSGGTWGWATWRRAWLLNDVTMGAWREAQARARAAAYWGDEYDLSMRPVFEATAAGRVDSWAYPWQFARAVHAGLSVVPVWNLITNIGHSRGDATHTVADRPLDVRHELPFPLVHNPVVMRDEGYFLRDKVLPRRRSPGRRASSSVVNRLRRLAGRIRAGRWRR